MAENYFIEDCEKLEALAPITGAPIERHVFICTGKSCSAVESAEVKNVFERELISRKLLFGKEKKGKNPAGSIVLTECGSVGFCAIGAAVMVYPDGVWYAQVRPADVLEIIEEHLLNGRVVKRLALLKVPQQGKREALESGGAMGSVEFPKTYGPTTAPREILALVERLMPMLLQGEHPALKTLRDQYGRAVIRDVKFTGVGFYVNFDVPQGEQISTPPNFAGGSAKIEISSAPNGAGCVLFVRDGRLSVLEAYTYGSEQWLEDARVLALSDVVPINPK